MSCKTSKAGLCIGPPCARVFHMVGSTFVGSDIWLREHFQCTCVWYEIHWRCRDRGRRITVTSSVSEFISSENPTKPQGPRETTPIQTAVSLQTPRGWRRRLANIYAAYKSTNWSKTGLMLRGSFVLALQVKLACYTRVSKHYIGVMCNSWAFNLA